MKHGGGHKIVCLKDATGEDTLYADSDKAERFSLFETFAGLSATDADGALSLARDLDDLATRIRSLINVARAMTRKAQSGVLLHILS